MYKLKTIRLQRGMTQQQLATISGVSHRVIRSYEAESRTAHKDINRGEAITVWRLSQALGVDISDLLELEAKEDTTL